VKGSVYQRGKTWTYRFLGPEADPATGKYPTISKGGFVTEKEAWKACRDAMREADRGRVVRPSIRTVAQFLAEWFAAVEASLDATTWQNWKDYADAYVVPRIGEQKLQKLDEPQLLKLYATLLAEGRVKRCRNSEMFQYWSARVANGENPKPIEVSEACGTTIHAARTAIRRYKSGIVPTELPPGLAPKTVRNIHAMIHRALVDAVAWKHIPYNPASNIRPPKRPRRRRTVWNPSQIKTFLMWVQRDRFAALFLLELTTGIRRVRSVVLSGLGSTSIPARSPSTTIGWSSVATCGTRLAAKLVMPTKRYRLTGPPLPRCVDGASGKMANGNCSAPSITRATTCSPSRTAGRRTLTRSDSGSTAWQQPPGSRESLFTISGTRTRPAR
jgi:hypothetical protein